jgi:hypothetical protein
MAVLSRVRVDRPDPARSTPDVGAVGPAKMVAS